MSSIRLYETFFLITPIYSSLECCTKSCDTTQYFSMGIIGKRRREFSQIPDTIIDKPLDILFQPGQSVIVSSVILEYHEEDS